MRCEPGEGRTLDEAGRDASHLAVWIKPRPRSLQQRGDVGRNIRRRRAWLQNHFRLFPLPVVPLSYESTPILNRHVRRFTANTKSDVLIAANRRRQHVQPAYTSRQRNLLPTRNQRIRFISRTETESYSCIRKLARQHFTGQRETFAIETAFRSFTVAIRTGEIVGQIDRSHVR